MPRKEDYNAANPMDQRFSKMSDEEFLHYASDPEMDRNFLKFSQAEKTAFLNRALMLEEDSAQFEKDLLNRQNYLREDGPDGVKRAAENHESINDRFSDSRDFHYTIYREILYTDETVRPLATDITTNMSATNIVKNAGKLRGALFGHLMISREAEGEVKDELLGGVSDDRMALSQELGSGVYRVKEQAEKKKAEVFTVNDDSGNFNVTVRTLSEGEKPETLLEGFDAPETNPEEKRNMLLSYLLHGKTRAEAENHIREIQKKSGRSKLLTNYLSVASREMIAEDEQRLKVIVTGNDPGASYSSSLGRKVFRLRDEKNLLTKEEKEEKEKQKRQEEKRKAERDAVRQAMEKEKEERERPERERRQQAEQRKLTQETWLQNGKDIAADSRGRTWARYAELHKPEPGRHYSEKEKAVLLSKMMAARRVQMVNGQNTAEASEFNLGTARHFAERIRNTSAFKEIVKSGKLDEYLGKSDRELSDAAMGMFHPFHSMTIEQRREMLKNLKAMAPYLDQTENHGESWQKLKNSVDSLRNYEIENSTDPKKNGEYKFEEIFNNTIEYMKGRKSLRKTDAEQRRVEQTLDFMVELGKGTPYASAVSESVLRRTTEVRKKHNERAISVISSSYGKRYIDIHSDYHPEAQNDGPGISL